MILEINECCEQPERRRITRKIERRKIRNVSSVALHATIRNLAMRYGWSRYICSFAATKRCPASTMIS